MFDIARQQFKGFSRKTCGQKTAYFWLASRRNTGVIAFGKKRAADTRKQICKLHSVRYKSPKFGEIRPTDC